MQNTTKSLLVLTVCAMIRGVGQSLAADDPPMVAANQRYAAAEQAVADCRAKRDALADKLQAMEQKLQNVVTRLGLSSDPRLVALNESIRKTDARAKTLQAQFKQIKLPEFNTLAQMEEHDRLADQRKAMAGEVKALEAQSQLATRERNELTRQMANRDVQGAALIAGLESLRAQLAVANKALSQAQADHLNQAKRQKTASAKAPTQDVRPAARAFNVPPPADAAVRLARFQQRNTPAGVRELGGLFFSRMTLTLPGLEKVRTLVEAGQYGPALDEYKRYFFARLAPGADGNRQPAAADDAEEDASTKDGEAANAAAPASPPAAAQIERALQGICSGTIKDKGSKPFLIDVHLGQPGAINWVFAKSDDDWQLDFCRQLGNPLELGATLRNSYVTGGPREHLLRWADLVDDWAMNWPRDVERSPLPVRDYNLLVICRIQALRAILASEARARASFVADLPATTLARLLMVVNEEYISAAIRLGRSGTYNFRIMALNSMIPTSLQMQEFHAHQWALHEGWRQVDNNFIYKTRRDGANFEFANDGHEDTDQSMLMHVGFLRKFAAQPDWLEPFWDREFIANFLQNTRYWVHNLKQDGFSYRLNARTQRGRYTGDPPEYKINLLTNEPEVWRRMWKIFGIGQPMEKPQIDSESMAFQGYYYLRNGWEPEDYFLYFQCIGQPILSGREDCTGFNLYDHNHNVLLAPATRVDGKVQNIHYGLVLFPGGKGNFCTYGLPDAVKTGRFLAGAHFDFAEGAFKGVYQYGRPTEFYYPFGTYGADMALVRAQGQAARAGKPFEDEPIKDVGQARQILAVKGRDLFIVTDTLTSGKPHQFTQYYTMYTPVRSDSAQKRLAMLHDAKIKAFTADEKNRILATHNIGLPNTEIRHVSSFPVKYTYRPDQRPAETLEGGESTKGFNKRDRQEGGRAGVLQFGQEVAVSWEGQGTQILVSVISAPGAVYTTNQPSVLRDVQPIVPRADEAGFTGRFADGTDIGYIASATPAVLQLGGIEATASTLLITGGHGLALDCSRLALDGKPIALPCADFEFVLNPKPATRDAQLSFTPIYRPIKPVVIEPLPNVFTDTVTVTLDCATPGVGIRYTLDGSKPVPQSPLYTGPFKVDRTCWLKARAFRPGVTTDIWQEDGTYATVVYTAVLRKESPAPAVTPVATTPGLKYEYFEGIWTELMASSLTQPSQATGVCRLLDVGMRKTDGAFGVRYEGLLDVPQDGVYTFYAPHEFTFPDNDCGYDLRVFVDGQEWYPAVRWQAHGTWSVALRKGPHAFKVVFVDLRLRPHKIELMWGFPHPDFTWKGVVPTLMISGPGLEKQAIPDSLLHHEATP